MPIYAANPPAAIPDDAAARAREAIRSGFEPNFEPLVQGRPPQHITYLHGAGGLWAEYAAGPALLAERRRALHRKAVRDAHITREAGLDDTLAAATHLSERGRYCAR